MSADASNKQSPKINIDPDVLEEAASVIETQDIEADDFIEIQDPRIAETMEVSNADDALKDGDDPEQIPEDVSAAPPVQADQDKDQSDPETDFKDRFIRLSADFDNFRKRIFKEKTDYIKYGNEALLRELLPIMDNFERAMVSSSDSDAASILQGVQMILLQLTQTLEKFGLNGEKTLGQLFDPNLHEAVSNVEDDQAIPNTIIEEHQKLYRYHEKLLRPALVTVAKPKP